MTEEQKQYAAWCAFLRALELEPISMSMGKSETVYPDPSDVRGLDLFADGPDYMKAINAAMEAYRGEQVDE